MSSITEMFAALNAKLDTQATKLDVQATKLDVQATKLDVQATKLEAQLDAQATKLDVQATKLDVQATKLEAQLDAQAETLAHFIRSQSSNSESYSVALRGKRALEACIKLNFECMLVTLGQSRTLWCPLLKSTR